MARLVEEDLYAMTTDVAVRGGSSALAIADGQSTWTQQQLSTLEQLGLSGAGDGDLAVFFHQSVRTGLDPFAKQIYMIARRERVLDPATDQWVSVQKWTIQTGIDGYRLVARRAADRAGQQLTYEDTLWCGPDGVWRDVWLAQTPPLAAKVVVYRGAERFSAVAHWPEYVQTKSNGDANSMWSKMGRNQLAKCAEALALRKAFPQDLSGIYTDDEMGQADARQEQLIAAEAERADRAAARPAQQQRPTVVDGDVAASRPAAAGEEPAPARDADGPAAAAPAEPTDEELLASIAAITDAAGGAAFWRSLTDELLARDVEDPSGNSFTVKERIIARVEQLQRDAGKPVAPDGPPAEAAGDGTLEAPLEGEVLDAPDAHRLVEPDPEDLRKNSAQRRALVTELINLLGGKDVMEAACEQEFAFPYEQVGTRRLREWLQREQQADAARRSAA